MPRIVSLAAKMINGYIALVKPGKGLLRNFLGSPRERAPPKESKSLTRFLPAQERFQPWEGKAQDCVALGKAGLTFTEDIAARSSVSVMWPQSWIQEETGQRPIVRPPKFKAGNYAEYLGVFRAIQPVMGAWRSNDTITIGTSDPLILAARILLRKVRTVTHGKMQTRQQQHDARTTSH